MMKEISFQEKNFGRICEELSAGEVCIFPSDTSYGFSADPFSKESIQKIQKIKNRSASKPFLLLVTNECEAEKYGILEDPLKSFAVRRWKEADVPTTVLLPKKKILKDFFPEHDLVGIRVPIDKEVQKFLNFWKKPLISTSANFSGEDSFFTKREIWKNFSENDIFFVNSGDLSPKSQSEIWQTENTNLVRIR